eukprot:TRINITY_DN13853_c0_g1_i1.p1 TRINITY_DN13853_c0_g1~~TRINITY_DN13853_c0_g1_i1.p1  ORF type:complete len:369 (-),score=100.62 TRINITY_DN13853_c0_g1_i1:81-1166(-)
MGINFRKLKEVEEEFTPIIKDLKIIELKKKKNSDSLFLDETLTPQPRKNNIKPHVNEKNDFPNDQSENSTELTTNIIDANLIEDNSNLEKETILPVIPASKTPKILAKQNDQTQNDISEMTVSNGQIETIDSSLKVSVPNNEMVVPVPLLNQANPIDQSLPDSNQTIPVDQPIQPFPVSLPAHLTQPNQVVSVNQPVPLIPANPSVQISTLQPNDVLFTEKHVQLPSQPVQMNNSINSATLSQPPPLLMTKNPSAQSLSFSGNPLSSNIANPFTSSAIIETPSFSNVNPLINRPITVNTHTEPQKMTFQPSNILPVSSATSNTIATSSIIDTPTNSVRIRKKNTRRKPSTTVEDLGAKYNF